MAGALVKLAVNGEKHREHLTRYTRGMAGSFGSGSRAGNRRHADSTLQIVIRLTHKRAEHAQIYPGRTSWNAHPPCPASRRQFPPAGAFIVSGFLARKRTLERPAPTSSICTPKSYATRWRLEARNVMFRPSEHQVLLPVPAATACMFSRATRLRERLFNDHALAPP